MPSRDLLSYCFYRSAKKKRKIFTAQAESSMFTSFDLSSYCGKKTGCISLSFSLMLCWVNNDDAILKVNPYLEDILCIRKFRPLCSFPSRCVRLGEDPISEATRKQICETRIEDEREYKVFVTVVCYCCFHSGPGDVFGANSSTRNGVLPILSLMIYEEYYILQFDKGSTNKDSIVETNNSDPRPSLALTSNEVIWWDLALDRFSLRKAHVLSGSKTIVKIQI